MRKVWIVGSGYIGQRVAAAELALGGRVHGLARSDASITALTELGAMAHRADLDDPTTLAALDLHDACVYYFAPPPARGTRDSRIQNFLEAVVGRLPRRIVYISTTGVYGDCHGEWVNEDHPPRPSAERAHRRVDAETQLRTFGERHNVTVVILRVPGIYGPGRLPRERLEKGLPVLRESESPWSNRIHADDLVSACLAAMTRGTSDNVYNVSDGHPSTMTDYFNQVADALGLPRPRQVSRAEAEQTFDAGMRSYLAESRRIDNHRMLAELGVALRYPTLAEGLRACVAAEAVTAASAKA